MSTSFDKCFAIVVFEEGKYSNDPYDNGGATKYGITQKTLSDWRKKPVSADDVRELSLDEAKSIYDFLYWRVINGDAFPISVSLLLFDAAVNSGASQSVKWLQRALGVKQDGNCGPITIAAWKAAERSKIRPAVEVLSDFVSYRLKLMAEHEDYKRFGGGWFSRVAKMCLLSGKQ